MRVRARIILLAAVAVCLPLGPNVASAGPSASITPGSLLFGEQCVGAPGDTKQITISNNGDAPMNVSSVTLTGANPSDFTLSGAAGQTLGPGASMKVGVRFLPIASGDRSATVRIGSDAPSSPNDVPVSGSGVTRILEITPTSLAFGDTRTGNTADELVLSLASTGSSPVTITGASVTGEHKADFTASLPADRTLSPGEDGVLPVSFRPRGNGTRRASVSVESNACAGRTTIGVTGTGTAPKLEVRPSPVSFGAVAVGQTGSPVSIVAYNEGRAPLRITDIAVEGAQSGDFQFGTFPDLPRVLGPGDDFEVTASFAPTEDGPRRAILRFTSDDPARPALTIELVGNVDGAGSPSPSPSPSVTSSPTLRPRALSKTSRGRGGLGDWISVTVVVAAVGGIFTVLFRMARRNQYD